MGETNSIEYSLPPISAGGGGIERGRDGLDLAGQVEHHAHGAGHGLAGADGLHHPGGLRHMRGRKWSPA